jgi:hypothetical protein
MISDQEALGHLRRGEVQLSPLTIKLQQAGFSSKHGRRSDAVVQVRWHDRTYDFDVEYKPYSTPRMLRQAVAEVQDRSSVNGLHPMVLTPYLSEENLRELEVRAVSGLDLSGNGVVVVPGELLVFRTGSPNRFPSSERLKNVYRGASSLVPRVLAISHEHSMVTRIRTEIQRRGGALALSTVSKVLKVLEEDLIVGRDRGAIQLLQPVKLLDRLVENFQLPRIARRLRGRLPGGTDAVMRALTEQAQRRDLPLAVTGAGSAPIYSVVARGEVLPVYCPRLHQLVEDLPVEETERFPNLELLETEEQTAYFDLRYRDGYPWASPVQTYLELTRGDKRDQETAAQLRELLLEAVR